jgi:pyruvate carboxylase
VTVYFELNGQPRPVRIADKSRKPRKAARPKADAANGTHLGSPMPGLVVSLAVRPGERVEKGDLILNLEAMKMQTAVIAERAGTVRELTVAVGHQVDAKDLLAIIE